MISWQDDSTSSVLSLLVSAGLFLGTTLVSKWVLHRETLTETNNWGSDGRNISADDQSLEDSGTEWYNARRLRHRLSFTRDDDNITKIQVEQVEVTKNGYSSSVDPDDFFPKNSNWNHFERDNEERKPLMNHLESLEGDFRRADDEDLVDSDTESLTSEAHFVWTEARYSPDRHNNGSHPPMPTILSDRLMSSVVSSEQIVDAQVSTPSVVPEKEESLSIPLQQTFLRHTASLKDRAPCTRSPSFEERVSTPSLPKNTPPSVVLPAPQLRGNSSIPGVHVKREELERNLSSRLRYHTVRAQYNARIMPSRVVLVRHGQSMGNIDEHLYATTPDNAMPLTKLGFDQAHAAGKLLKEQLLDDSNSVHFIVSPYVRTVETFHGIASAWCDPSEFNHIHDRDQRIRAWYGRLVELGLTWHEDPRIREQDFGNYQNPEKIREAKRDRHRFGAFYYRFPHGESASDVYDRISTFLDSLWRQFDMNRSRNYVIVTHGIAIRVLLARYFRYTIDQFHLLSNPRNCEMVVLKHDGHGRLELDGRHELECNEDHSGSTKVIGYRYHKRLRVLPKEHIYKVRIRIAYDD